RGRTARTRHETGTPIADGSRLPLRIRQISLLNEQAPVMSTLQDDGAKVPEIPSQYLRAPLSGHGHHDQIGNVGAAVLIAPGQPQRELELCRRRSVQSMNTAREALGKRDRRVRLPASPQQKIHLDEDWPR